MCKPTLKEKRVLKQCPWGTILKNSAFFDKNGTILVPLWHQNEVVPFWKVAPKWCPKGYRLTDDQTVPSGHCFGATYFFECSHWWAELPAP